MKKQKRHKNPRLKDPRLEDMRSRYKAGMLRLADLRDGMIRVAVQKGIVMYMDVPSMSTITHWITGRIEPNKEYVNWMEEALHGT